MASPDRREKKRETASAAARTPCAGKKRPQRRQPDKAGRCAPDRDGTRPPYFSPSTKDERANRSRDAGRGTHQDATIRRCARAQQRSNPQQHVRRNPPREPNTPQNKHTALHWGRSIRHRTSWGGGRNGHGTPRLSLPRRESKLLSSVYSALTAVRLRTKPCREAFGRRRTDTSRADDRATALPVFAARVLHSNRIPNSYKRYCYMYAWFLDNITILCNKKDKNSFFCLNSFFQRSTSVELSPKTGRNF